MGATEVRPQADDSHASMTWVAARRMLVGQETRAGYRVGLRLADQTLSVHSQTDEVVEEFPVVGLTLVDAMQTLGAAIGRLTGVSPSPELSRPEYDLPPHPVGSGAKFSPVQRAAFEELARWYANGAKILAEFREEAGASALRCWPHHFDLATLITLEPQSAAGETSRSIGLGLSPGDGSYEEPYFYVTPWPPPEPADLPRLDGAGFWHTENWVGAVLPAGRIDLDAPGPAQAEQVRDHLRGGLVVCRNLLSAS